MANDRLSFEHVKAILQVFKPRELVICEIRCHVSFFEALRGECVLKKDRPIPIGAISVVVDNTIPFGEAETRDKDGNVIQRYKLEEMNDL